jgi:hypothetical protein
MRQLRGGRPQAEIVTAWSVSAGDRFPGGETAVLVDKEAVSGIVTIVCDTSERRVHGREDRLTIMARDLRPWSRPRVPRYLALDSRLLGTAVRVGLFSPQGRESL